MTAKMRVGIHAPGMSEMAGRMGGLKGGRIGGLISMRRKLGVFAPGMAAKGGRKSAHKRWHVMLKRFNSDCRLCSAQRKETR